VESLICTQDRHLTCHAQDMTETR